jgi:hypothetical protein
MPRGVYKRKPFTKEHCENIGKGNKGKIPHNKNKTNIERYGGEKAKEISKKMSISHSGKPSGMLGKSQTKKTRKKISVAGKNKESVTKETKQKQREVAIKRIEKQKFNGFPIITSIGKYESEILDILEETIGYPIIRQYRVAGYFLDGYCPDYSLAIEVDEKYHKNEKRMKKDEIREDNIKKELNCKFIRIEV